MFTYKVQKSFWVAPGSNVNWDTEKQGREGVGIPLKVLEQHDEIQVIVENRGVIFTLASSKALAHHREWNTGKTAPDGTQSVMVIIPTQLMDYIGKTHERIESEKKEEARKVNFMKLTKKFCISLFERVRETYQPKTERELEEHIHKHYPENAMLSGNKQQKIWGECVREYLSERKKIADWNQQFNQSIN